MGPIRLGEGQVVGEPVVLAGDPEQPAEQAAEQNLVMSLLALCQPCREKEPDKGEFHLYSDRWLNQQFAGNAWSTACCFNEICKVRAIVVERPAFWPFGVNTTNGGRDTTRKGCGMPYDTRFDLVCETILNDGGAVWPIIIEFKTKTERAREAASPVSM